MNCNYESSRSRISNLIYRYFRTIATTTRPEMPPPAAMPLHPAAHEASLDSCRENRAGSCSRKKNRKLENHCQTFSGTSCSFLASLSLECQHGIQLYACCFIHPNVKVDWAYAEISYQILPATVVQYVRPPLKPPWSVSFPYSNHFCTSQCVSPCQFKPALPRKRRRPMRSMLWHRLIPQQCAMTQNGSKLDPLVHSWCIKTLGTP